MSLPRFFNFYSRVVGLLILGSLVVQGQAPTTRSDHILRSAETVFVDAKSNYMNREALERELLNHPDFNQLGLVILQEEKGADLILEIHRKRWTTRFTATVIDPRSKTVLASCEETSLGGEIEPKLANCFINIAKAARVQSKSASPTKK